MALLPKILSKITKQPRDVARPGVDFEWSPDSWTHNAFRFFEVIFGRKIGIKPESSIHSTLYPDGRREETIAFHSTEALLKFAENRLRNLFRWKLVPVRVYLPVLAPVGAPSFSSPYLLAVAFVDVGSFHAGTSGATQSTGSFSAGTTNGLIFCSVVSNSAITWNSIVCTDGTLTNIDTVVEAADVRVASYYFLGTTTATQTVTAHASGTTVINISATSYSGVNPSGQPDNHTTGVSASSTGFTQALTTIADNCWLMMGYSHGDITGAAITAGTGTILRDNSAGQGVGLADSNGAKSPAGPYSLVLTASGNDKWAVAIASFAPIQSTLTVSVSDSLTNSEATTPTLINSPSVFDSISLSENIQLVITPLRPSIVDSIALSENIATALLLLPSVFDTVSLGESAVLQEGFQLTDSVSLTENIQAQMSVALSVFDTVTTSENVSSTLIDSDVISDSIALSESVSLTTLDGVSVTDSVTLTDSVVTQVISSISVFDSATNTESITTDSIRFSPQTPRDRPWTLQDPSMNPYSDFLDTRYFPS